jgi:muconolactone delta-isomerase
MSAGARGANLRAKNAAMAADLKARGVTRSIMKCPMCHAVIGIGSLFAHLGKAGCRTK